MLRISNNLKKETNLQIFFVTFHSVSSIKVKGKVRPRRGHEGPEGEQRYSSTLSITSALDVGGWLKPRPGRFTPGNDPVHIV